MRVSILDDYQGVALDMADWSRLRARGVEIAVERHPFADEDDVVRSLADSEIVAAMRERTAFPKRVVDRLPKLKLLITTGMRNASFDMGALKERGVTVCGTGGPGGGNEDTAELAWGLILGAARRIAEDHQMMRQGGWQTRIGHRVAGKTIGLLGLGRLGSAVARVGLAFGMQAIAWSQNLTADKAAEQGVERVEKDELFRRSDILSVHLVLSPRSRGLVGKREIGLMKPSAILVNTSRGPICDTEAVIEALKEGRLAYAGFVGGSGADITLSVSVDPNGNAYVGGATASRDFPVTVGPDLVYNGGEEDAFVAKIGFELGVSITSGPSDPTNQTTASFEFSADVVDPTFRCSLDGAALTTCTSPAGYSGLSDGEHSFVVEETDQSGDSTSATWNWRVETVPPTITSFTPAEGSVGKKVTINGSGFLAATGVSFGGVSALFSIISENQIQTTVPKGALTGTITVSNPAGSATSTTAFRVRPTIKSFTPTTGPAGTSVVINGSAFTGATAVLFNGVSAAFTVNSYTQITATVPAGATTGPITVVTPSGKAFSKTSFTVT